MVLFSPFPQLHDLDRTSSEFCEQLNTFFRGDEYRGVFPKLQCEELAWLGEYLDSVSLQATFLCTALSIVVGACRHFRSCRPRIPAMLARTREDSRRWESVTEIVHTSRVSS